MSHLHLGNSVYENRNNNNNACTMSGSARQAGRSSTHISSLSAWPRLAVHGQDWHSRTVVYVLDPSVKYNTHKSYLIRNIGYVGDKNKNYKFKCI